MNEEENIFLFSKNAQNDISSFGHNYNVTLHNLKRLKNLIIKLGNFMCFYNNAPLSKLEMSKCGCYNLFVKMYIGVFSEKMEKYMRQSR